MDQMKNLIYEMDNFDRQLNSTKFRLAQLDVLAESIKHSQCKGLAGSNANFALSSLCTKWMQFNAGLERINEIRIGDKTDDESQAMTTATANKFIMYSILDEFQLNDSTMPNVLNGGNSASIARKHGYIGTGYISHIENEMVGLVYIVDVARTPDALVFFGAKPKRLTYLPQPGEMFGYVFNEKYLVRAIRIEYESGIEATQKRQYSAWLMDIGCTVRIDIKPSLYDHYEVTEVAKTIPAYAERFQLAQIPDQTNVCDLLHTRIQYKVIFIDNDLGFVDVRSAGANPFAVDQQNEWNFYMYYFGNHRNALPLRRVNKQLQPIQKDTAAAAAPSPPPATTTTVAKRSQPLNYPKNTNPFLNEAYEIENAPMNSLTITKSNPFYSDSMENLYETSQIKQKFVNFKLNKLLNIEPSLNLQSNNSGYHTNPIVSQETNAKHHRLVEEKILNGNAHLIDDKIETAAHSNQSAEHVSGETETIVRQQKQDKIENTTVDGGQRLSKKQQPQPQQHSVTNFDLKIQNTDDSRSINKSLKHNMNMVEPNQSPKSSESAELADQKTCNGDTLQSNDFPQPKSLPQVGDTIKILYQVHESLETFYATVVDDPERNNMAVHQFSLMLNDAENAVHFEPYGFSTPKLFDKVLALYGEEYYRAKVISVIDEHSFHVFYVDYGNCAKLKTAQLFKYDKKWDKYPVYALRFRINGIEETNPWDYDARKALEQILIADCNATVVRIQYCEKTKRTTYVVDLYDENGMNVAETLVQKNLAIFAKDYSKAQSKHS